MKATERAFFRIHSFFDSYARAVGEFNTKALVQHYAVPCLITSDDAHATFTELSRLEGTVNQGFYFYRQQGISRVVPELRSKVRLTDTLAQAKVRWIYYNTAGTPVYDCDYQYLLHLGKDDRWQIQVAVSINEKEKMQALLQARSDESGI